MGDETIGESRRELTERERHFNDGVDSCAGAIDYVIDLLRGTQAKQGGFAFHITGAKIHLAEQLKAICEHRILPRVPGETREEFEKRAAAIIS